MLGSALAALALKNLTDSHSRCSRFSFRAQKRGTMERSNEKCRLLVRGDGAKAFVKRVHTIEALLFCRFYCANISRETNACPCLGEWNLSLINLFNFTNIYPL